MTQAEFRRMLLDARIQANLAAAVYAGREAVQKYAFELAASNFRYVRAYHSTAGVVVFDNRVYVSIGGSDDKYDWLQNVSATQRWSSEGLLVHSGYAEAADWIKVHMKNAGVDDYCIGRKLILGGHSAGGAIAQILAMDPAFFPQYVLTFGAPRVMSPASAAMYRAQDWSVHQFVADGDPVPNLPLRKFRAMFGKAEYANTEAPLILREDGSVVTDRESGLLSRLARITKSWVVNGSLSMGLLGMCETATKAHRIGNYQRLIDVALKKVGYA